MTPVTVAASNTSSASTRPCARAQYEVRSARAAASVASYLVLGAVILGEELYQVASSLSSSAPAHRGGAGGPLRHVATDEGD